MSNSIFISGSLKRNINIGIIGCGWLGIRLATFFSKKHIVYTTTTSTAKQALLNEQHFNATFIQFSDERAMNIAAWEVLEKLDAVIISVPFSKKTALESLQNRFKNLLLFLHGYQRPLFLLSSIGIYPNIPQQITEDNIEEGQLQPQIRTVEKTVQQAFPQVSILRLAGLMGDDRYLSKYLLSPIDAPVNHVHYEDICHILLKIIEEKTMARLYNVVAPMHPGKRAVVNYQRGMDVTYAEASSANGRIISTIKLQTELPYRYIHENPLYFKEFMSSE